MRGLLPGSSAVLGLLLAGAFAMAPAALAASAPTVETTELHGFVSEATARFLGTLNPNGAQIQSCLFEYGTTTAYGQSVPCDKYPEANEAGTTPYVVGAEAEGLAPQTTYHYRLLADNGTGPVDGGDRTLSTAAPQPPPGECPNEEIRREQGATALPGCMAYELISPADTAGNNLEGGTGAPDGEHAIFGALLPLTADQPTGNASYFLAHRTPEGWQFRSLADPSQPGDRSAVPEAFSEDFRRVALFSCNLFLISCLPDPETISVVDADGSRQTVLEVPHALGEGDPLVVGASADLSTLLFELADHPPLLAADTHIRGAGLYASHQGHLEYLGLGEDGSALPCGAVLANGEDNGGFEQDGISADGETVAYESPDPRAGCPQPVDVYVRRDAASIDISAPRNGNPDLGATYAGISRDGDRIYFVTASRLLESDADSAADIYAYDVPAQTLTRITSGAEILIRSSQVSAAAVAVSPQGDYLYFVARHSIQGLGADGHDNLFLYHAGTIALILTAPPGAVPAIGGPLGDHGSAITPDGTHLLFAASAPLTGQPIGATESNQRQVFQYDAATRALLCLSCPPDGSLPTATGYIQSSGADAVYKRLQSDDGGLVVFETASRLLPQDTNGEPDDYVWNHGALALLVPPTPHQTSESQANGMSADGTSIYFFSPDRLLAGASQGPQKLYVARSGGGFPPATALPECLGDPCRGPLPPSPQPPAPRSAAFAGPGDPPPLRARCRRRRHAHRARPHCPHRKAPAKSAHPKRRAPG